MIGVSDKHLSLVDTCHVVETVHLHKYWPPVRFPPTVHKCDTIQKNRYLYKQISFVTSCRLAHCIALGRFTQSSTTALSQMLREQAPCTITITGAFLKHTSRGNPALQDIPGYFMGKRENKRGGESRTTSSHIASGEGSDSAAVYPMANTDRQ